MLFFLAYITYLEQLVEVGFLEGAELGQVHFFDISLRRTHQRLPQRSHHLQNARRQKRRHISFIVVVVVVIRGGIV